MLLSLAESSDVPIICPDSVRRLLSEAAAEESLLQRQPTAAAATAGLDGDVQLDDISLASLPLRHRVSLYSRCLSSWYRCRSERCRTFAPAAVAAFAPSAASLKVLLLLDWCSRCCCYLLREGSLQPVGQPTSRVLLCMGLLCCCCPLLRRGCAAIGACCGRKDSSEAKGGIDCCGCCCW